MKSIWNRFTSYRQWNVKNGLALLSLASTLFSPSTFAELSIDDANWELRADKGNIQVYTRDYEGSNFEAFKAVATLNAPINNIMSVMVTPESCLEWVHGCSVSYGLENLNFYKRYAYSVNDLPWPFKDRDYVLEINTSNDQKAGTITMEMHAAQDKKPESDDYVRVNIAQTIYVLTPTADNKTQMVWLQHTDPAGVLPGWLVNQLIIDIPVESLRQLEKVAQKEKYQGARIVYDDHGQMIDIVKPH